MEQSDIMSENNKNVWSTKRLLQLIIQVAVLGYIVYYIFQKRGELSKIWNVDWYDSIMIVMLSIVDIIIRAWLLCFVVKKLGGLLKFSDSFFLTNGTRLLNCLPMNIGTVVKARVLKKHSKLKYAHFVSVMSANVLFTILTGGVLGLGALFIFVNMLSLNSLTLLFFFSAAIIVPLILLLIPPSIIPVKDVWIYRVLKDLLEGLKIIRSCRRTFSVLILCSSLFLISTSIRLWICFNALNTHVGFAGCIIFAILANLILIVNVTPASMGIREVVIGGAAKFLGFSFERGLFAASLGRVFGLSIIIVLGSIGLFAMKKRKFL